MIEILKCECLEFLTSDACKELLKGRKVCIVTDPPFNIGYHYKGYKDRMKEDKYLSFLKSVLNSLKSPFVVIHYPEQICHISMEMGKCPDKIVSWVYNSNTAKQHRDIAYYGIKPNMNKVRQPYKNPNDKRIKERIARGIKGGRLYDWWNINQVKNVSKKNISHPCVMPVEVMRNAIGVLPEEYVIIDPFLGSGTTGVAAKQLGRDFIGCEINEEYFNEAIKRITETKRHEL